METKINLIEKEVNNTAEYETKFRIFKDEVCMLQEQLNKEIKHRIVMMSL